MWKICTTVYHAPLLCTFMCAWSFHTTQEWVPGFCAVTLSVSAAEPNRFWFSCGAFEAELLFNFSFKFYPLWSLETEHFSSTVVESLAIHQHPLPRFSHSLQYSQLSLTEITLIPQMRKVGAARAIFWGVDGVRLHMLTALRWEAGDIDLACPAHWGWDSPCTLGDRGQLWGWLGIEWMEWSC